MDKDAIMRKPRKTGPKVNVNIKVSRAASEWMREKNYSPTGIFFEALKDLGFVEPEQLSEDLKEIEEPASPTEVSEETTEEPHPQSYDAQESEDAGAEISQD